MTVSPLMTVLMLGKVELCALSETQIMDEVKVGRLRNSS